MFWLDRSLGYFSTTRNPSFHLLPLPVTPGEKVLAARGHVVNVKGAGTGQA